MQIGISSYSYSRMVASGAMEQIDAISKTKELGFDVLEFSKIKVPEGKTLIDFAHELREEADRVNLRIANYTIGADFLNGSNGNLEMEIERVQREVDIAKILGAPSMRHDASTGFKPEDPRGKSFDDALPILVEGCRAVTEYAASLGIRTMVENHGYFCQDSQRVEKLAAAVAHKNFGILVDMGNFICVDEDPGIAIGRLLPYMFHVHAKDFHLKPGYMPNPGEGWNVSRGGNFWRGAIIGHGDVPIIQCLRAIKRANYNGVLSIEFEGMEDVLTGARIGQKNLRDYVQMVYQA